MNNELPPLNKNERHKLSGFIIEQNGKRNMCMKKIIETEIWKEYNKPYYYPSYENLALALSNYMDANYEK